MSEHYRDVADVIKNLQFEQTLATCNADRLAELHAKFVNRKNLTPNERYEVEREMRLQNGAPSCRQDLSNVLGQAWAYQRAVEMLEAIDPEFFDTLPGVTPDVSDRNVFDIR